MRRSRAILLAVAVSLAVLPDTALTQDAGPAPSQDAGLAQQLSNPVADLISVPFQFNYDGRIGPGDDGRRATLNIQPVIPISLNPEWNLISRTILPVVSQWDIAPGAGHQFGLGDTLQSLFLSPRAPGPGGIIWGVGPVALLPTATDDLLGAGRWGVGPTAVVLRQSGPWTVGVLANHIWSAGGSTRGGTGNVSNTFVQPFISYTTADAWTFTLQSESSYSWATDKLTVPINAVVAKLVKIGDQRVSLFVGARYYAFSPEAGPKGLGLRAGMTLLFPK
jgi:hypothetical protein